MIFSCEFLLKSRFQKTLPHRRFLLLQRQRHRDVSVKGRQREIIEFPRARIKAVQAMGPSSNKNRLTEPWFERNDEFRESFEF
jgi:hypothetical protein